jgi:hypothetical protein
VLGCSCDVRLRLFIELSLSVSLVRVPFSGFCEYCSGNVASVLIIGFGLLCSDGLQTS